ncbi:MAG: hypothetical protein WC325_13900 [Candidatus Bathyarchaeia archaeon]|jgi:hypothetical protein
MTTQTSIESYKLLDRTKTENERQTILNILKKWQFLAYSHNELSRLTGIPVNVVESRCTDLKNRGDIMFAGIIKDSFTGRSVQGWKTKNL